MKKLMICIAAGLLVAGAQTLSAQTDTNSTPSTSVAPATHHKGGMTAEQRKQFMKAIGLTKEDLKGLSGEDRKDKIKEAAQKTVDDLKAKKAAGTLTDEQQSDLTLVEKFLAHGHKKKAE